MHAHLHIRICREDDLAVLEKRIPSSGRVSVHAFRYARQQEGHSVYLIAWLADVPVGHLDLWWQAVEDAPSAQPYLAGCPELNGIAVLPEYRSQGIGTRLIAAAEEMVHQRGLREVCVGVEIENTRARALRAAGLPRLGAWHRGGVLAAAR